MTLSHFFKIVIISYFNVGLYKNVGPYDFEAEIYIRSFKFDIYAETVLVLFYFFSQHF